MLQRSAITKNGGSGIARKARRYAVFRFSDYPTCTANGVGGACGVVGVPCVSGRGCVCVPVVPSALSRPCILLTGMVVTTWWRLVAMQTPRREPTRAKMTTEDPPSLVTNGYQPGGPASLPNGDER